MKQDIKYRLRDSEGKEYIIIDSEKVDLQEELNKTIVKQMKKIERLTKQNKALNDMYELTKKEYIRLNNIINELENYLSSKKEMIEVELVLDKLQELKGEDKE